MLLSRALLVLLLLSVSLRITAVDAAMTERPPLLQLVQNSDLAVGGSVAKTTSSWNDERNFIWTQIHVRVRKIYFSKNKNSDALSSICVVTPGGSVDGVVQSQSNEVRFKMGEEVVLFLKERHKIFPSCFSITNSRHGRFNIKKGIIIDPYLSTAKPVLEKSFERNIQNLNGQN